MSRTLLIIQSHAEAYEQVQWSWPHYQLPGWDIMGVCPEDSVHSWPHDTHAVLIGRQGYSTPNLVRRWLETWKRALLLEYSDFCMIEYDAIFLRKPPSHPGGLFTHLAGGGTGSFKATKFYHTPWHADRAAAEIIVDEGQTLVKEGEFEHGSPDFFLGLISDRRPDLKVTEANTWSCNGGSLGHLREHAERSIREGAWYLHGLRRQDELDWILKLRDACDSQV